MSAISAATSLDAAATRETTNRFSELTSEDFIELIVSELTSQDPLEPNDTNALLQQINSIRQIESDLSITTSLESVVTENQLATAGGLIGAYVIGRDQGFASAEGFVVAAGRRDGNIVVELANGSVVPMENVTQVLDPNLVAAATGGQGSATTPSPLPAP